MAVRVVSPTARHYPDLRSFLADPLTNGQAEIIHRAAPIDVLVEDKGNRATVVYFHAALGKIPEVPLFLGRGMAAGLEANAVYISDPSVALNPDLRLAWYAGNARQPDLQVVLTHIVRAICAGLGSDQLVFFGSSGGGFASLMYSSQFPGSVAVAVNPQTIVPRYIHREVATYAQLAWGRSPEEYNAIASVRARLDMAAHYQLPVPNTVVYVQNSGDINHMVNHREPFIRDLHPSNLIYEWLDHWGVGHVPPPKDVLAKVLRFAVSFRRVDEDGHHPFAPTGSSAVTSNGKVDSDDKGQR